MATRLSLVLSVLVALPVARTFSQTPATLAGVVRDSAGAAVTDVEVILRDATRGTRTNARGEFTLGDVTPGAYRVWFRRLGYASAEYNWAAHAGEKTDVVVTMRAIPRQLDPVVVRAEEDRRARAHASILGLVIDSAGTPIPEAEVQLVGADASGMTRDNGGFLFKPLAVGTYVVRVRKIGFEPGVATMQLVENDDREVIIRLRPLATGLDPVVVTERSGYGSDQAAWDELERRKRWVDSRSRFLGPEDLKNYYGATLDLATVRMGVYRPTPTARNVRPTHIDPRGTSGSRGAPAGRGAPGGEDACILLNGKDPVREPLRVFSTNDVELLEVYPSGTDQTGTVGSHFNGACAPTSILDHPTYYVVWLQGHK